MNEFAGYDCGITRHSTAYSKGRLSAPPRRDLRSRPERLD